MKLEQKKNELIRLYTQSVTAEAEKKKAELINISIALKNLSGKQKELDNVLQAEIKQDTLLKKLKDARTDDEIYTTLQELHGLLTRKTQDWKKDRDDLARLRSELEQRPVLHSTFLDLDVKWHSQLKAKEIDSLQQALAGLKQSREQIVNVQLKFLREELARTLQEYGAARAQIDQRAKQTAAKEAEYLAQIGTLTKSANEIRAEVEEMFKLFLPDAKDISNKTARSLAFALAKCPETLGRNIDSEPWVLLLKAADTDLAFSSPLWNNEALQPDADVKDTHELVGRSAKYSTFCTLPVSELLVVFRDGSNERKTQLRLPQRKPLREVFADPNPSRLEYLSGAKDPIELICGSQEGGFSFYEPVWRINSFSTAKGSKFKCRLGGYFHSEAEQPCGTDKGNCPCGARMAGFGLEDKQWQPLTQGKKSFGVRCSADRTDFGKGQLQAQAMIYGR